MPGIDNGEKHAGLIMDQEQKIQQAREKLERILSKFNGSENHKQIRMLRRRVLKKLLKEAANQSLLTNNSLTNK